MKLVAAAVAGVLVLVLSAFALVAFWNNALDCPPQRSLELSQGYGYATTPWLELNDTDLAENQVLRSMFDAWYNNASGPGVGGSQAYGVSYSGSPGDLQTVDEFLRSRGYSPGEVPIRYRGDSFVLRNRIVVC